MGEKKNKNIAPPSPKKATKIIKKTQGKKFPPRPPFFF